MNISFFLICTALSIFLQGFFSGSEFALVNSDKRLLKLKAGRGSLFAKRALKLIRKPEWFFSTTIITTNLCAVFTTTLITFFIIENIGSEFEFLTLFCIPFLLLFSEILPRSFYLMHSNRIAPLVGTLLLWISYFLFPVVWVLFFFGKTILGRKNFDKIDIPKRRDLDSLAKKSASARIMPREESWMIQRILDFSHKNVANVMTPLINIEALEDRMTVREALQVFEEEEYSKMPVYSEEIVKITGYVICLDLLDAGLEDPLRSFIKPVEYVPESMGLEDLYRKFKSTNPPLVIVVDEYGGTVGLVTLEDILEELVGEIEDEYDIKDDFLKAISSSRMIVNAQMEVEALKDQLGVEIPKGDYETLGGFLLNEFNRIPEVGDSLQIKHYTYVIRKVTPRSIKEVEIIGNFSEN